MDRLTLVDVLRRAECLECVVVFRHQQEDRWFLVIQPEDNVALPETVAGLRALGLPMCELQSGTQKPPAIMVRVSPAQAQQDLATIGGYVSLTLEEFFNFNQPLYDCVAMVLCFLQWWWVEFAKSNQPPDQWLAAALVNYLRQLSDYGAYYRSCRQAFWAVITAFGGPDPVDEPVNTAPEILSAFTTH